MDSVDATCVRIQIDALQIMPSVTRQRFEKSKPILFEILKTPEFLQMTEQKLVSRGDDKDQFIFCNSRHEAGSVWKEGPKDSCGGEIHEGVSVIQHLLEAMLL